GPRPRLSPDSTFLSEVAAVPVRRGNAPRRVGALARLPPRGKCQRRSAALTTDRSPYQCFGGLVALQRVAAQLSPPPGEVPPLRFSTDPVPQSESLPPRGELLRLQICD